MSLVILLLIIVRCVDAATAHRLMPLLFCFGAGLFSHGSMTELVQRLSRVRF